MVASRTDDFFFWKSSQSLQKMVAFRTEDLFFEIAPSVKPMPPIFSFAPKKFRSGYVPERHGHIFLKMACFFDEITSGSNFIHNFSYLKLNHKMSKSSWLRH